MRRCRLERKAVIQLRRASPPTRVLCSPLMGMWKTVLSYEKLTSRKAGNQIQHHTVDHLARGSMKNGANSVTQCELQDT